jgi:hypothetical protein
MSNASANIIILTTFYSIIGDLSLRDKRLSDVLNDRQETVVRLRNTSVTSYRQATKQPIKHPQAVVPKDEAIIVFETAKPQMGQSSGRLYGFVKKQAYDVYIIMNDIEVRGQMFTTGTFDILDIHRMIATSGDRFYPVTSAIITLPGDRTFNKPEGILINGHHIDYLGKLQSDTGHLVAEFAKERGLKAP